MGKKIANMCEISKNPVYYVCVNNMGDYDAISELIGGRAVLSEDRQLMLSASDLREKVAELKTDDDFDWECDETTRRVMECLDGILAVLDRAKFNGDVWFYFGG